MSIDNSILSYNNDATFSGDATAWYITCTKGGRITAKEDMYIDVFIVGGGGGGGTGSTQSWDSSGGGGGGGGYRVTKRGIFLAAGSYADITVGVGGNAGTAGGASTAFGYTANGGGAGGNATSRYFDGAVWVASVPGQGGAGGANGGKGVYINGYGTGYVSSEAGSNGGYAFDDSTWSSTKYGAGGGGGSAATNSDNSYGDIIWGYYITRNSGNLAPGGETGGGMGGDIFGPGSDATNYGGGGGGGGCRNSNGGKGYQGIVIIRSARGGYSLTVTEGNGSSIEVKRTISSESDVRTLLSGAKIYSGDVLKISFSPLENYELLTHTVNGSDFTSGNTYSVIGDTSVAATARPLASAVGATDANIESTSTITVTRYVDTYYHSLQFSFGSLSGYIASDGSISATEERFSSTSVAFAVPSSFYAQIPNAKTGVCTITCRTYETLNSQTTLGEPRTCTFTATASEALCAPTVVGVAVDTSSDTIALTGDNNILVRFKSNVQCTITATARNSSTITSKLINGQTPTNDIIVISGNNLSSGAFTFTATDSRGYTTSVSLNKTLVAYINLTINPVVYRPSPATGEVKMSVGGNYFNGSFGAKSNTLTIRYRYKETSVSVWGSWITVSHSNYSIGTQTYSSSADFLLADENNSTTGFDYQKAYNFQIQALDGADGTVLTTVSSAQTVQRGIPVFDWGENDFRFNVPVRFGNRPASSVPMGQVDSTSTATAFTATVDGITELYDGVWCYLKNGVVTSAANCTLNVNGLGAKPLYSSLDAASRSTTIFNINYTMLFIYNSTRVAGGCWDVFYGYDSEGSGSQGSQSGTASKASSIPMGAVDATSTATAFTATVDGISELRDGVCCYLRNGVITSAANCTLNINSLGAKPLYSSLAAASRSTTIFNINYTMLFIYNSTRVDGGCWDVFYGYDSNTNTIGYQLRTNSLSLPMSEKVYRYRLLFTSADGTKFVPANTSTSTNATASRTVNQTKIDPFGKIVYYGYTAAIDAGSRPGASYMWSQYVVTLGYSFNRTGAALVLNEWKPVYIKCAPQSDGSAIIDQDNPYVQSLPSTADGKIYIFLGIAVTATTVEIVPEHPVYAFQNGGIVIWTGADACASFVVTYNNAGGAITCDKTYAEIVSAVQSKKSVCACGAVNGTVFAECVCTSIGTNGDIISVLTTTAGVFAEIHHDSQNQITMNSYDYKPVGTILQGETAPATSGAVYSALTAKLDKDFGSANAGKWLKIDTDGSIIAADLPVYNGGVS